MPVPVRLGSLEFNTVIVVCPQILLSLECGFLSSCIEFEFSVSRFRGKQIFPFYLLLIIPQFSLPSKLSFQGRFPILFCILIVFEPDTML